MPKYSVTKCMKLLKEEKIESLELYAEIKKEFKKMGAKTHLFNIKRKDKQSEALKNVWHDLVFPASIETKPKALFIADFYVYDDATFANFVEEALSAGIDPQNKDHIISYLNAQGYKITKSIYNLKLAEFETYKKYYEKTSIWYMVKDILERTKIPKASSIEDLQEYKRTMVPRNEVPAKDMQKVMAYPNGRLEDEAA